MVAGQLHTPAVWTEVTSTCTEIMAKFSGLLHTKNYKSTIIELVSSQRPCTKNSHCACVDSLCEGFI